VRLGGIAVGPLDVRAQVAAQRPLGVRDQRVANRDTEDDADSQGQEDGHERERVVAKVEHWLLEAEQDLEAQPDQI
jgi:hypothetical protein